MIKFKNLCNESPYLIFQEKYNDAQKNKQKNIEAICISSYSSENNEVNARYVNLKFIIEKEFIFFSNYKSQKSIDFESHNQITGLFHWNNTNTQIRIKANIKKTSKKFNQDYFAARDKKKNALAISSNQSQTIESYAGLQKKYEKTLQKDDLKICPDYWGGFSFTPYYFEFWEGHESRINKREVYELAEGSWAHYFLQA